MDTCTNCGTTLRPGAKFCTTCGTRVSEILPVSAGWDTPRPGNDNNSSETTVITMAPAADFTDGDSVDEIKTREHPDTWADSYADAPDTSTVAGTDPASNFVSALDNEIQESVGTSATETESTDVFTPPVASSWAYSTDDDEDVAVSDGGFHTWGTAGESGQQAEVDADTDNSEISQVNDSGISEESGIAAPMEASEARDKAIALVEELRLVVRQMSSGTPADDGAAIMALTEARLNAGDFSDVRGTITEVRDDPRDIQALGNMAAQIDRIEELLNEHATLVEVIETTIRELSN